MNLLQKIFKKEETQKFKKTDLFLYVQDDSNIELREEKDYFIIGCYNDDRSQFTNLATQEVFQLNTTYGNTLWLNVKGRTYSLTSGFGFIDFLDDDIVLKVNAYLKREKNFLIDAAAICYHKPNSKNFKRLSAFYYFLRKGADDDVSLKEIQKASLDLNEYVYCKIAKELEKSQNINL